MSKNNASKVMKKTMKFYNMSDFLRGKSSQIITKTSDDDDTAFVMKHGKPVAVLISHKKYERLMQEGIDIEEI
ncbi:type II toxin-antitoxin system Phd/YefM family antitoxin [Ligilactobacillus ceti]|uniref:type II toxin-antitoxin system Phd/YefM family antitoxin n=1 Tax=Ligilactobacillus ceti TaxID=395085 RepID=UPI0004849479|nr:type II toxin-antitoxin system Phd/YefM family antitoxin [Ligilactobacillus ceti]